MSKISPVPLKFCHQWSSGHLFLEIFHRNVIEASKFSMRTEVVEGRHSANHWFLKLETNFFPRRRNEGENGKAFSKAGYVLDRDSLNPRCNIYLLIIFFSDGCSVTQGKHGKGCSWRSEKSQWRLYLWREMGDGSDWEAAGLCCLALTVSNCCWHSGGLFWPRLALGTAEKLRLLEFSPLRFTQQLGFKRVFKKKKRRQEIYPNIEAKVCMWNCEQEIKDPTTLGSLSREFKVDWKEGLVQMEGNELLFWRAWSALCEVWLWSLGRE